MSENNIELTEKQVQWIMDRIHGSGGHGGLTLKFFMDEGIIRSEIISPKWDELKPDITMKPIEDGDLLHGAKKEKEVEKK